MSKIVVCKIIFVSMFFFALNNYSYCQDENGYSISGTLVDSKKVACDYYVLSIHNQDDSAKVSQILTDEKGGFVFTDIKPNVYFIKMQYFSQNVVVANSLVVEKSNINIGEIALDSQVITLTEVEIKSTKPVLKKYVDHYGLKVKDSYLSKSAFEIFEIMNLIPSVNASPDGIKIKNSSGILYLIDGRGNRNTNEINKQKIFNLSSKDIDRIEVYTNPPAKFEADGSSVINVVTIKNIKISSVYSNNRIGLLQNNPYKNTYNFSNGANINYRIGNLGIFSNIEHRLTQEVQTSESQTDFNLSGNTFENKLTQTNSSPGVSLNLGTIYKINDKNEICVDYSYDTNRFGDSSMLVSDNSLVFLTNNQIDSSVYKTLTGQTGFSFNNLNVGYWSDGKNMDYDFQLYFDGYSLGNSGTGYTGENVKYVSSQHENNYGAMLNIQDSILGKIEFRTGVKVSRTRSNEFIDNDINKGFYRYEEQLKAAYAQLSGSVYSIDWLAGLRVEATEWEIDIPESTNGRYMNFFPSVFLSKNYDNFSISTSYTKRIQRQDIAELNPLLKVNDKVLTTQIGNVGQLKPQLFDSYELNFDFSFLNINTYFNRTKNTRLYFPVKSESQLVTYLPQSAAYENTFGISVKAPFKVGAFRGALSWASDVVESALIDAAPKRGYSNFAMVNMNYSINKSLMLSSSLRYTLPEVYNYMESNSNWVAYFGVSYQKQNSPFVFRVNVNDIFGRRYLTKYLYPLISETSANVSFQRVFQCSVRYNFKLGKNFNPKSFEGLSR